MIFITTLYFINMMWVLYYVKQVVFYIRDLKNDAHNIEDTLLNLKNENHIKYH